MKTINKAFDVGSKTLEYTKALMAIDNYGVVIDNWGCNKYICQKPNNNNIKIFVLNYNDTFFTSNDVYIFNNQFDNLILSGKDFVNDWGAHLKSNMSTPTGSTVLYLST